MTSDAGNPPTVDNDWLSLRILLVEDDPLVRRYARSQLLALGYQVELAENGPAAMRVLREAQHIDLLLTDVMMPGGMNGAQLAEAARELRPDLRVLFSSGYSAEVLVQEGRLPEGVQMLHKPYRKEELARRVRQALS